RRPSWIPGAVRRAGVETAGEIDMRNGLAGSAVAQLFRAARHAGLKSCATFIAILLGGVMTLPMTAQQRGRQGGPSTPAPAAGRGRASASPSDRIGGHPNLNGIWQAINTANWNLEDHAASATTFWQLGAMFAIPPGQSVIVDNNGTIPYTPEG